MKHMGLSLSTAAILAVSVLFSMAASHAAAAETYYVIVNAANSYGGGDDVKEVARRLFLKEVKDWPGGNRAVPFVPKASDGAFEALKQGVLSVSGTEYDDYWARKKQTTGDTPPRSVGSSRILVRLIGRDEGALGVVASSDAGSLNDTVKVLFEFEY